MTFVVSDDDVVVSMLEILARDDVSVSLDRDSDYTVRNPSESARTNSFSLSFSFLLFPSPSPLSLSLFLSLSLSFSGSEVNRFRERVSRWHASSLRAARAAVQRSVDFHFTQPPRRGMILVLGPARF